MICDDILASGDDAAIRAHAAACPSCRPVAMLLSAPKLAVPEGAYDEHLRRRRERPVVLPGRGWLVAAAAALFMAAAAMFYGFSKPQYQPMAIMIYDVQDSSGLADEVTE